MTVTPVGTHCILELNGCNPELLNNEQFVRDSIEQASHHGMSTLLNLSSHQFDPQGVTAIGLLSESHISIHTWPEHGYAAIDVFTCGETAQPHRACEYLIGQFESTNHELKVLPRGASIPSLPPATVYETPEKTDLCPTQN